MVYLILIYMFEWYYKLFPWLLCQDKHIFMTCLNLFLTNIFLILSMIYKIRADYIIFRRTAIQYLPGQSSLHLTKVNKYEI